MEPKLSYLPWPEAVAGTVIAISTAFIILASSYERIFVANQYKAGTLAPTGNRICQEPDRFVGLWFLRTIFGLLGVLFPIAGMWFNFYQEQNNGLESTATSWAAGSLVCCICSSIVYEVCLPAVGSLLCWANVYLTASTIRRLRTRHHRVAGAGSRGVDSQRDWRKPGRIGDNRPATAIVDGGMLLPSSDIDGRLVARSRNTAACEVRVAAACLHRSHRPHHRDLPRFLFPHARLPGPDQPHLCE